MWTTKTCPIKYLFYKDAVNLVVANEELDKFLAQRHKDVTIFDFEGRQVPCIVLDGPKFENIMRTIAGKPVSVETNLNILQDGLGHVFVRVTLQFSQGGMEEKFLIYANENMDFFESLAETSMIALSANSHAGSANVFMIQLPRPEGAQNALDIIRKGLHQKRTT